MTTLVLIRHGVTALTADKRFSGGLASSNPSLTDEGRSQVARTARWLDASQIDAVVASPVRRTVESAEIVAEFLGKPVTLEPGVAEMEFGEWDGLTFAEANERQPAEMKQWLGSLDARPGRTGESFREVQQRVLAGRDRILADQPDRTVVVVSHVTPIKTLVADALGAPLEAVFRMDLAPASVSVVSYFREGPGGSGPLRGSLGGYNARPTEALELVRHRH